MTSLQIIESIKNNLFRKDKRLDGNKTKRLEINYPEIYNFLNITYPNIQSAEQIFLLLNNEIKPYCKCGKPLAFKTYNTGYCEQCSDKTCTYRKQEILIKIKEFNLSKYGVENTFQAKEIKDKIKETNIKRYGVENPSQSKEISQKTINTKLNKTDKEKEKTLDKRKETNIKRYGVDNIRKYPEFIKKNTINKQRKIKQNITQKTNYFNSCVEKYKDLNLIIESSQEQYLNDEVIFRCSKCNTIITKNYLVRDGSFVQCPKCKPYIASKAELVLCDLIYPIEVIRNDRQIIKPKEIDILVPEFKFGIEYNGLMFHSYGKSKHSKFTKPLELVRNQHIFKTNKCEENNIQLFHIFENEYIGHKKNIWNSMINNKLQRGIKIYARKCVIKEVPSKDKNIFLDYNHLQGKCNSSINIGLYYEDELVSIMTFGKCRYSNLYEYELYRFCTKLNHNVIGGASKLLKYFERNYNPKSLLSYANRRWSTGNVYEKLDFTFKENTKPNYFYFKKGDILESRLKYQKHKLKDILEDFDETLTETENMFNNYYKRIYDSGNKVYFKKY